MRRWIRILVIGLPLVEITGLVLLGMWLGFLPVLAEVIGTGILGSWLLRSSRTTAMTQGVPGLQRFAMAGGNVARMASGTLLMIPGVLSDLLGAILLLPPARRFLRRRAQSFMAARMRAMGEQAMGGIFGQATGGASPEDLQAFLDAMRRGGPAPGAPPPMAPDDPNVVIVEAEVDDERPNPA